MFPHRQLIFSFCRRDVQNWNFWNNSEIESVCLSSLSWSRSLCSGASPYHFYVIFYASLSLAHKRLNFRLVFLGLYPLQTLLFRISIFQSHLQYFFIFYFIFINIVCLCTFAALHNVLKVSSCFSWALWATLKVITRVVTIAYFLFECVDFCLVWIRLMSYN